MIAAATPGRSVLDGGIGIGITNALRMGEVPPNVRPNLGIPSSKVRLENARLLGGRGCTLAPSRNP